MTIDAITLRAALQRWSAQMVAVAPELNALDGQLGDGDLGATLEKCAMNVANALPQAGGSLSEVFRTAALACAQASGSSFGTLLAQGFLTAAKHTVSHQTLARKDVANLLATIGTALAARGGASLGDKTVLDPLNAVAQALAGATDEVDLREVARKATDRTLDQFRERPNKIGRARMFAERTIGVDDPGMLAFKRMVECL